MYLIGRGRKASQTYPSGPNAALVALTNRYLIDPAGPLTPGPVTPVNPNIIPIAGANVVRRASGLFMVAIEMPFTLAAPDTVVFSAVALSASVSGGTPSGSWLVETPGSPLTITPPVPAVNSEVAHDTMQLVAGGLQQTAKVVGVNPKPILLTGPSSIVFLALTLAGTLITPGDFFASAYELP